MKWYNILVTVIIICVVVFIQRKFFPEQVITTHSDTIYVQHTDTITVTKLIPYKEQLPPDTIFIPADTSELIKKYKALHQDFYTKRYYSQEYKVDTMGTATVKGKVFMNRLDSLTLSYNLHPVQIINTTTIANVKNNLYIGGQTEFKTLMPYILFDNKQKYHYLLGYNITNKQVVVGFGVNINRIWKKK